MIAGDHVPMTHHGTLTVDAFRVPMSVATENATVENAGSSEACPVPFACPTILRPPVPGQRESPVLALSSENSEVLKHGSPSGDTALIVEDPVGGKRQADEVLRPSRCPDDEVNGSIELAPALRLRCKTPRVSSPTRATGLVPDVSPSVATVGPAELMTPCDSQRWQCMGRSSDANAPAKVPEGVWKMSWGLQVHVAV